MTEQPVLRVVAKFLIPLIVLFALYVQFHGEYSPGGGFQAGVIFGSALTFYGLVFGVEQGTRVLSFNFLRWLSCAGILLFGGVGVATVLQGGAFLDYNVLAAAPVAGQHWGILLVELGVGLTVAGILVSIFFAFADRGRQEPPANSRLEDAHPRVAIGAIPIGRALSSSKRALVHREASHRLPAPLAQDDSLPQEGTSKTSFHAVIPAKAGIHLAVTKGRMDYAHHPWRAPFGPAFGSSNSFRTNLSGLRRNDEI